MGLKSSHSCLFFGIKALNVELKAPKSCMCILICQQFLVAMFEGSHGTPRRIILSCEVAEGSYTFGNNEKLFVILPFIFDPSMPHYPPPLQNLGNMKSSLTIALKFILSSSL